MKLDTIYSKLASGSQERKNKNHRLIFQYSTIGIKSEKNFFEISVPLYFADGFYGKRLAVNDIKFGVYKNKDDAFATIRFCISPNGFATVFKCLYRQGRIDLLEKIMARRCHIYFSNNNRKNKLVKRECDYFDFIRGELELYTNA